MPYLDYEGLSLYKTQSDELYLPVILTGSLAGEGSSVSTTITNSKVKDSMVPFMRFNSDPSVITGNLSVTVNDGSVTVTAVVNGTLDFSITLTEKQ